MRTDDASRVIAAPPEGVRLGSVDGVRGVAMVLMVLEHCHMLLFGDWYPPTVMRSLPPFVVNWIPDFCAPTFFLLAGVGAGLRGFRPGGTAAVSRYLVRRGLWLVVLEVALLGPLFGSGDFTYRDLYAGVLFSLALSMVLLAALVWLPAPPVAAAALALIVGHNAFDHVDCGACGRWAWAWRLCHDAPGWMDVAGKRVWVVYALVPLCGVMALGYAAAGILRLEPPRRRRWLVAVGGAMILAFAILRGLHGYGDEDDWLAVRSSAVTLMDFLHCTRYPPSLHLVLLTVGTALVGLAVFDGASRPRALLMLGRVPLFFYVLHLAVIGGAAALLAHSAIGQDLFARLEMVAVLLGRWGPLAVIVLCWLLVLAVLYFPCRWYAELKARRRWRVLEYL